MRCVSIETDSAHSTLPAVRKQATGTLFMRDCHSPVTGNIVKAYA
ncbi:hypothetical protein [Taibaiella koreensis]|nr:hypothetical protein [Taibaiella koreensis]